jgi:hypothetical protein
MMEIVFATLIMALDFRNSAAAAAFLPELETKSLEGLGGFWREWFR